MLIACVAMTVLLSLACNQTGRCDEFVLKTLLEGPSRARYEYRGWYVNLKYNYSVRIPRGLTGYDGRDVPNHDGFGFALGKAQQSYVFVAGEYNSAEYATPREAAAKRVEYLRQDGAQVESETISNSRLGALDAARIVVVYTCPGSSDRQILSSLIALSVDKEFLYTLEIYSPANRYKSDRAVLGQIIRSWKMISGSRQKKQR